MLDSAPASLARQDMVGWAMTQKNFQGHERTMAQVSGDAAYDWMSIRAGMLNPDQKEEQARACQEYVQTIVNAQRVTMGFSIIAVWLLSWIIEYMVKMLLGHLFSSAETLQAFQAMPRQPESQE
jgi:hypothetical protein